MHTSPSSRRSPRFGYGSGLVAVAGLLILACGGAEHNRVPEPIEAGAEPAKVSSEINICPRFEGSLVMPKRIGPDESSVIAVSATDPDAPDSLLIFDWNAPSGSFSENGKSVTSYRCAEIGSQRLTVTAEDRWGCVGTLTIDVECLAK